MRFCCIHRQYYGILVKNFQICSWLPPFSTFTILKSNISVPTLVLVSYFEKFFILPLLFAHKLKLVFWDLVFWVLGTEYNCFINSGVVSRTRNWVRTQLTHKMKTRTFGACWPRAIAGPRREKYGFLLKHNWSTMIKVFKFVWNI